MAGLTGHGHNHSVRASATSGQWVPDAPTNISDRPLRGASEEWGSTLPAPSRLLDRSPSSRSIRPSIRLPDRRGALRCAGGGGCGECWARGRPRGVSGGVLPCGVRSTELCPPEKLKRVSHTTGPLRISCATHARVPPAPCDPASGSRTGGALRRGRGGSRRALGWGLLTRRFRCGCPMWCAIHGAVPT